jgi:hypothetical protein
MTLYASKIVVIANTKRVLAMNPPAEFKIKYLEYFDKFTDRWLTADLIAMIEPLKPQGVSIWDEVKKLGWQEAFNVVSRPAVWSAFTALHPTFETVTKAIGR